MLAEQREHAVVGHDRRFLVKQMIFQGPPVNAQGLEEKPVWVVLGKAHLPHSSRYVQAEVFDKPGGGDETIQQGCGTEFALDLVIEARPRTGITGQ
ncbi:hypothetical protein D3C85_1390200 [compost metagenome]